MIEPTQTIADKISRCEAIAKVQHAKSITDRNRIWDWLTREDYDIIGRSAVRSWSAPSGIIALCDYVYNLNR